MIRLSIVLLSVLCLAVGSAGDAAAPTRPKVSLELKRTGFAYRWEYSVAVRVRATTGKPIPSLRVATSGVMDIPGHYMEAGPVRLADRGAGVYRSKLAFYMPGRWRIIVSVKGATVTPSVKHFDVELK